MEVYDTSLLQSIRHTTSTSDALAATLLQHWDDHLTRDVFNQATAALGDLWNNEAAGICGTFRHCDWVPCEVTYNPYGPWKQSRSSKVSYYIAVLMVPGPIDTLFSWLWLWAADSPNTSTAMRTLW